VVVHRCHRGTEQRGQAVRAQRVGGQRQLVERALVAAENASIRVDDDDALEQRADELGPAVKVQPQSVVVVVRKPMVLDHARRHAHQAHRVLVVGAVVAGDVEDTEDAAARVEDRHRRAGEEVVRVHEMFVGMHERRSLLEQGGADRIRALRMFGPVHTRGQRHLARTLDETFVAHRVQDGAVRVGQDDHAFGVDDLLEQHLHHRCGVLVQTLVSLTRDRQIGAQQGREVGALDARQAERSAALVRSADQLGA
jgi:hypothetical protein